MARLTSAWSGRDVKFAARHERAALSCAHVAHYAYAGGRSSFSLGAVTVRSTVALFAAPAGATSVLFFSDLASGRLRGFPVVTVLGFGVIAYSVATGITATLGMSVFSLLRRFNLVRWWSALASGAGIGFLVDLAFGATLRDGVGIAITSGAGALSALIFWLVVRPVTAPNQRLERP